MTTSAWPDTNEKERIAIQDALKDLIGRQKQVTFIDPDGDHATDERSLACILSRFTGWDANEIIEIAALALEDANFDDLAAKIRRA